MPDLRRVFFLTANRAEYDLLEPVARATSSNKELQPGIVVAGAHLSPFHGMTIDLIREDGLPIVGMIDSLLSSESWQGRSLSFAQLAEGLTRLLAANRPQILFIAGDREEALAGAIVANFLGICVAHAFGGDRCIASELDEALRPAISKLSHFHFTATEKHRERLIRMGELPERVWTVGGTGLDRLSTEPDIPDEVLNQKFGIDVRQPFFLVIQHPSPLFTPEQSGCEMEQVLQGVLSLGHPVLCSYPNYDPGNVAMRQAIDRAIAANPRLRVFHTLARREFIALYRRCSAIVGNSSSIVIESGFLKVPGVLVGPRQDLRETGPNVIRVNFSIEQISGACARALEDHDFRSVVRESTSIYGDGHASERISRILSDCPLDPEIRRKVMPY